MGVDVLNALRKGGNAFYTSERFVQEAVLNFGEMISSLVLKEARESPFYSVMVDETTDVSVKKELIIYLRYIDNSPILFQNYLSITELKSNNNIP